MEEKVFVLCWGLEQREKIPVFYAIELGIKLGIGRAVREVCFQLQLTCAGKSSPCVSRRCLVGVGVWSKSKGYGRKIRRRCSMRSTGDGEQG